MEYGVLRPSHGFIRMKPAILWGFLTIIKMSPIQMAP